MGRFAMPLHMATYVENRGKSVELPSGQYRGKVCLNKYIHRNAYQVKPVMEYNLGKSPRLPSYGRKCMLNSTDRNNVENYEIKNS